MAEISESDFEEWRAVYQRASTSVQNRLLKLEESYELIEKVRGPFVVPFGKHVSTDGLLAPGPGVSKTVYVTGSVCRGLLSSFADMDQERQRLSLHRKVKKAANLFSLGGA